MNETVLFLHVLAGFAVFATVVVYVAIALGAPVGPRGLFVADRLWDVGGLGVLVFGVWLALDAYSLTDGWILGALVLFVAATAIGMRTSSAFTAAASPEAAAAALPPAHPESARVWHWLRAATIVAILALMIFKPGA